MSFILTTTTILKTAAILAGLVAATSAVLVYARRRHIDNVLIKGNPVESVEELTLEIVETWFRNNISKNTETHCFLMYFTQGDLCNKKNPHNLKISRMLKVYQKHSDLFKKSNDVLVQTLAVDGEVRKYRLIVFNTISASFNAFLEKEGLFTGKILEVDMDDGGKEC